MTSFSPDEYLALLASKQLPDAAPVIISGMVKDDPDDKSVLLFTMGSCEEWIALPLTLIERVDHIGEAACKDHKHPLARLSLDAPHNDKHAAALLEILRRTNDRLVTAFRAQAASGGQGASSTQGCHVFHGMKGLYVCCTDPNGGPEICTGMALQR